MNLKDTGSHKMWESEGLLAVLDGVCTRSALEQISSVFVEVLILVMKYKRNPRAAVSIAGRSTLQMFG
jgi:hypothetical protein